MKKNIKKKVIMTLAITLIAMSLASLAFDIEVPCEKSTGYVYEYVSVNK